MILNNPNRLWIKLISGEIKVNLLKISQRAGWFLRSCREIVLFYSWEKSKRLRELLKNASDQNSYFNKEKILWIQLNTLKYCNKEQISRIIRSMTPWKSYILFITFHLLYLFIHFVAFVVIRVLLQAKHPKLPQTQRRNMFPRGKRLKTRMG